MSEAFLLIDRHLILGLACWVFFTAFLYIYAIKFLPFMWYSFLV